MKSLFLSLVLIFTTQLVSAQQTFELKINDETVYNGFDRDTTVTFVTLSINDYNTIEYNQMNTDMDSVVFSMDSTFTTVDGMAMYNGDDITDVSTNSGDTVYVKLSVDIAGGTQNLVLRPVFGFIFVDNLSVSENTVEDMQVNTYPNPTTDYLNVSYTSVSNDVPVEVYNMNGQMVYTDSNPRFSGSNTVKVPMYDLPSGMYLVRVGSTTKQVSK